MTYGVSIRNQKEDTRMKVYLAGPMRGKPEFNFPAFMQAAKALRASGLTVFNPAESDNEHHGTDISKGNVTGDEAQAASQHGFSLREALERDTTWICRHADGIVLLPDWQMSSGANAELALARALGLKVFYMNEALTGAEEEGV